MVRPASTTHRRELKKNKEGTTGSWTVNRDGKTDFVHMVPADGKRHRAAETAG